VARVVAAVQDPDPRVDGEGFRRLRERGVEVDVRLLADAARALNEPFMTTHEARRPLVTLKAAGSLDGLLSARGGEARWITGPWARRFAHRLRLRHDAVLVGAGTVRRDDPRLTVRLPGVRARPLRVVLSGSGRLDAGARVFDASAPTRVYAADSAAIGSRLAGVDVRTVAARDGGADLAAVLADLGAGGVQSVLVEGGGRTLASFLTAGLADRLALFSAPRLLGARGATPMLDTAAVASPMDGWSFTRDRLVALGPDLLLLGRLRPHGRGGA
jgi:diaminohydroxyphosphoribosylaminopyrimidine deaminase/5-amino-6-(5-phosphoribosylamino)uracil reductase